MAVVLFGFCVVLWCHATELLIFVCPLKVWLRRLFCVGSFPSGIVIMSTGELGPGRFLCPGFVFSRSFCSSCWCWGTAAIFDCDTSLRYFHSFLSIETASANQNQASDVCKA